MESLGHAFTLYLDFLWGFSTSQSFPRGTADENKEVAFGDWVLECLKECVGDKPDQRRVALVFLSAN